MAHSMTGYGRGQSEGFGKRITVEIKSLNHRFLEIGVKLPRLYSPLEEKIKGLIKERVERGRIETYVNIEDTTENRRYVKVDKDLAMAYYDSLKDLGETLQITTNITVFDICQLPDVISVTEQEVDPEAFWQVMQKAVVLALDGLLRMRRAEGQQLADDLLARKRTLSSLGREIENNATQLSEQHRQKIEARLRELLEEVPYDEQRVIMEAALLADKSDITEELVRLDSHLEQLADTLASGVPVGRKLDFLVQEIHREVNTIGAKANHLGISQKVVEAKSELEKMREQVQNLE